MLSRNRVLSVAAVAFGVVLAFGIGELLARRFYERPWYDKIVAEQNLNIELRHNCNKYGLRDRDYPEEKPPSHRRVMVLGDSFTFGHGIRLDRDVFPEILERRLNDELSLPGVERIDVLNAALSGTLTSDWLQILGRVGPAFDPDVVLAVFFLRDGTRLSVMESFFGPIREDIVERNRRSILYANWFLYRMIRDRLDQLEISKGYTDAVHDSYFGNEQQTEEWKNARRNLRRLNRVCGRNGVVFGMVVYPILIELDEDYPFEGEVDACVEFASSSGIPVLSLLPAFVGRDATKLWISPYDQHGNERAHAVVAEATYPFLQDLLSRVGTE